MEKFEIIGGHKLHGEIKVGGAKNVAIKAIFASLLTDEEVVIQNVPDILDFRVMMDLVKELGVKVVFHNHTVVIKGNGIKHTRIPLSLGVRARTSALSFGPLLARKGSAQVPNPGGCRIGTRPIDRLIDGLEKMGAVIKYNSKDGYFYAAADKFIGTKIRFSKNTHTGTEALILASVLAEGETVLENAALEPEVDDLISLLSAMGAKIKRTKPRTIVVKGVSKLHGCEFTIMPDRNETITFAIAALVTGGDVVIHGAQRSHLASFLEKLNEIGGCWEVKDKEIIRFFKKKELVACNVETGVYPLFMTDWQAPWAVLMTQAKGISTIHETIFEDRFSYVSQLKKLGADIEFFNPRVKNPKTFYNFNWEDRKKSDYHAIRIKGMSKLHNAVLNISDLRAGATLVLGTLAAYGKSDVYGVEIIDRGYEAIEKRLLKLGGVIKRIKE